MGDPSRHARTSAGVTLGSPRLVVISSLVLILVAGVGIAGWMELRDRARAYESLVGRETRLTTDVLEMRAAVADQTAGARGFLSSRGERGFLVPYRDGVARFRRQLGEAREMAGDPAERRRLDRIGRQHNRLQSVHRRQIGLVVQRRFDDAARLAVSSGGPRRDELVTSLERLVSAEAAELYTGRDRVLRSQRAAEGAILGVLALALVVGGTIAVLALRSLRRDGDASEQIEAARAAAAEEAALARIATSIAHEAEPRAVLTSAAGEAAGLLEAASAAILRFRPGRDTALVVGTAGSGGVAAGQKLPVDPDDVVGRSRRSSPVALDAPVATPLRPPDAGDELAVPIWVGAHVWGAIWVASAAGERLPADAGERLVRFAELASASITSADARAHLAQLAHEDSLTGLANHRRFHEQLRVEVARAQRHGRPLSVVLFDIDNFTDVNDSHGHHVGDLVLRETADRLVGCARTGELVARVSGEQFGWILPETDGLDSYQAAERARRSLGATPMADGITVTVSAGVCDLEHAASSSELLRFADGALFWAKAHGRDITFRYSPDVVTELSADEQLEHVRRTRTIVGIRALARAVDVKDRSTARHSERVAELAVTLARALRWDERKCAFLHEAALVHDVGKIGVPDAILLKPSRLAPDEYETIKQHATLSAEIVNDVLSEEQVSWVLGHHERFDGSGYPLGLVGSDIPAGARILALADAWDVMTSERPYSPGRSTTDALVEVRTQAGRQFCPEAVRALEAVVAADRHTELPADSSM